MIDQRARWQQTALDNHCRLAAETLNPAYRHLLPAGWSE